MGHICNRHLTNNGQIVNGPPGPLWGNGSGTADMIPPIPCKQPNICWQFQLPTCNDFIGTPGGDGSIEVLAPWLISNYDEHDISYSQWSWEMYFLYPGGPPANNPSLSAAWSWPGSGAKWHMIDCVCNGGYVDHSQHGGDAYGFECVDSVEITASTPTDGICVEWVDEVHETDPNNLNSIDWGIPDIDQTPHTRNMSKQSFVGDQFQKGGKMKRRIKSMRRRRK